MATSDSTATNNSSLLAMAGRFVVAGGANTLLTYVLFVALAQVMPVGAAYATAFAVGIVFATLVNGKWVFGGRLGARNVTLYTLWYVAVFGVGLLVVRLMDATSAPAALSGAVAIACTSTMSFVGGHVIFKRPRGGSHE